MSTLGPTPPNQPPPSPHDPGARADRALHAPSFTFGGLAAADLVAESMDAGSLLVSRMAGQPRMSVVVDPVRLREDFAATPYLMENYSPESFRDVGAGGMGIVYGAYHMLLKQVHAIKVMTRPVTDETLEHFFAEAQKVANLKHPNVIVVHHVGKTSEGRPYFTMTFVPGGQTLSDKISQFHDSRGGAVSAHEWRSQSNPLLKHITTALHALHHVHTAGIVHRDLKPGNILVASGDPKDMPGAMKVGDLFLADFGLSAQSEGIGETQSFAGTPQYAAPEQVRSDNGAVSPCTDIYQMGLILWQSITNKVPFTDESQTQSVFERIAKATGPRELYGDLRVLAPTVPDELASIVYKALAVKQSDRYQSAQEFISDLEAFQRGGLVTAHKTTLPSLKAANYLLKVGSRSSWSFVRSHKWQSAAAAVALAAVGLGGYVKHRSQLDSLRASQLREQAATALTRSAAAMSKGDIEVAEAEVSSNLIDTLKESGDNEAAKTAERLEFERFERQTLLTSRKLAAEGYLAAIQSFDPTELADFDYEKLRQAQELYLPGGLTEESIAAFSERFKKLPFSYRERVEIFNRLTEISALLAYEPLSKLPGLPWEASPASSPEKRKEAGRQLLLAMRLADACNIQLNGELIRSVALADQTYLMFATDGQQIETKDRWSAAPMTVDAFLFAFTARPKTPTKTENDKQRVRSLTFPLRRFESQSVENLGSSLLSSVLEARLATLDSRTQAAQAMLNAHESAKKVGISSRLVRGRAVRLAGDLAHFVRSTQGGDPELPPSAEQVILRTFQMTVADMTDDDWANVPAECLIAQVSILRLASADLPPTLDKMLQKYPEAARQRDLAVVSQQLRELNKSSAFEIDKELLKRVTSNKENAQEDPVLVMRVHDALGQYDAVVDLMRNHAARYPVFKKKLLGMINGKASPLLRNTVDARKEQIRAIAEGK